MNPLVFSLIAIVILVALPLLLFSILQKRKTTKTSSTSEAQNQDKGSCGEPPQEESKSVFQRFMEDVRHAHSDGRVAELWNNFIPVASAADIIDAKKAFKIDRDSALAQKLKRALIVKAGTVDEILLSEKTYHDDALDQVREQKMLRLFKEALASATSCGEIIKVWKKIPTYELEELKSASVATLPGWANDSGVCLDEIKKRHDTAPDGSAAKRDINEKWVKLSTAVVGKIDKFADYSRTFPFVHSSAHEAFIQKWNAEAKEAVKAINNVDDAENHARRCLQGSDSQVLATARWNDLSFVEIQSAQSFKDVTIATRRSPSPSASRTAGIVKCLAIASTEKEVRRVFEFEGITEEIRPQLTAKLETFLRS